MRSSKSSRKPNESSNPNRSATNVVRTSSTAALTLTSLPDSILTRISQLASHQNLGTMARVSRNMHRVINGLLFTSYVRNMKWPNPAFIKERHRLMMLNDHDPALFDALPPTLIKTKNTPSVVSNVITAWRSKFHTRNQTQWPQNELNKDQPRATELFKAYAHGAKFLGQGTFPLLISYVHVTTDDMRNLGRYIQNGALSDIDGIVIQRIGAKPFPTQLPLLDVNPILQALRMGALPHLNSLDLRYCALSPSFLELLRFMGPRLKTLDLRDTGVDNAMFKAIATSKLAGLESLNLTKAKLTSAMFHGLPKACFPKLEYVEIRSEYFHAMPRQMLRSKLKHIAPSLRIFYGFHLFDHGIATFVWNW